jgi:hypothetical protein
MNKREILRFAIQIGRSRPDADLSIEQYLMTPESMTAQTVQLQNTFRDKHVLYLGDDDHMSVIFAYFLNAKPIVAEYDSRIRKNLTSLYKQHGVQDSKIIKYDAREPMSPDLSADAFYINPPYSSKNQGKGAKVWISRVAGAVPVGSTSVLVYPIDEKLPWTLSCMNQITNYAYSCGLAVVGIDRDLHTYGHLPKDPGLLSSNIYFYKFEDKQPAEIEDIENESLYR